MDVINNMMETIKSQVSDSANTDVLNKLSAAVESKSKSDMSLFPWGGSDANSEVNQTVNTYVNNKTKVNVENIIENSTFASFKNSNISDCIAKIVQSQEIEAGNVIVGKDGTFLATQEQRASLLAECIQEANVGARVVSDIVKFAGMELEVVRTTTVENEMEAEATSESEQQGIGGLLGNLLKMLGLGALAGMSPLISGLCCLCCCCCCCLLILLLVGGGGVAMFGMGNSGATTPPPETSEYYTHSR